LSALFAILRGNEPKEIQQKALCALGFSSHEDVADFIQNAFESQEYSWKLAAITAMGHSADKQWSAPVLNFIHSDDHDLQVAAIDAAGELQLSKARPYLLKLIKSEKDEELRDAAIVALSKIGGGNVRAELEKMLETIEDEAEVEFIEKALEELDFSEGYRIGDLMNVSEPDEDDFESFWILKRNPMIPARMRIDDRN